MMMIPQRMGKTASCRRAGWRRRLGPQALRFSLLLCLLFYSYSLINADQVHLRSLQRWKSYQPKPPLPKPLGPKEPSFYSQISYSHHPQHAKKVPQQSTGRTGRDGVTPGDSLAQISKTIAELENGPPGGRGGSRGSAAVMKARVKQQKYRLREAKRSLHAQIDKLKTAFHSHFPARDIETFPFGQFQDLLQVHQARKDNAIRTEMHYKAAALQEETTLEHYKNMDQRPSVASQTLIARLKAQEKALTDLQKGISSHSTSKAAADIMEIEKEVARIVQVQLDGNHEKLMVGDHLTLVLPTDPVRRYYTNALRNKLDKLITMMRADLNLRDINELLAQKVGPNWQELPLEEVKHIGVQYVEALILLLRVARLEEKLRTSNRPAGGKTAPFWDQEAATSIIGSLKLIAQGINPNDRQALLEKKMGFSHKGDMATMQRAFDFIRKHLSREQTLLFHKYWEQLNGYLKDHNDPFRRKDADEALAKMAKEEKRLKELPAGSVPQRLVFWLPAYWNLKGQTKALLSDLATVQKYAVEWRQKMNSESPPSREEGSGLHKKLDDLYFKDTWLRAAYLDPRIKEDHRSGRKPHPQLLFLRTVEKAYYEEMAALRRDIDMGESFSSLQSRWEAFQSAVKKASPSDAVPQTQMHIDRTFQAAGSRPAAMQFAQRFSESAYSSRKWSEPERASLMEMVEWITKAKIAMDLTERYLK